MTVINLAEVELARDEGDPPAYRSAYARLGPRLGASRTGATLYEIPPGRASCVYHFELGEEEWLLVLAGTPSLRTPEGVRGLRPGDLAFFPASPEGAHQILNEGEETARVLMWSEVVLPAATIYPDSDKVGVWTGSAEHDGLFERRSAVDYWHGEGPPPA